MPFDTPGDGSDTPPHDDDTTADLPELDPTPVDDLDDVPIASTVWHHVLLKIAADGQFKAGDLDLDVSQSSLNRTLRAMEHYGWLRRTSARAHIWRLGPTAAEVFDISEDLIERSRE